MRIRDWSSDVCSADLAAAEQLGMKRKGVAAVRVRRVNPPERERAMLRAGRAVAERSEAPERLLRALRSRLANGGQPEKPVREASAVPSPDSRRSEEHTSDLQSLMRNTYDGFCLNK